MSQLFNSGYWWFVPTVQTVHILCIAVVVITLWMLDFRLMSLTRNEPLPEMADRFLPWTWSALGMLLLTGTLLTITEPSRELMNSAFRLKMLMVAVLALLTFFFQRTLRKDPGYWSASRGRQRLGGVLGFVSLCLVVSIVVAGRLIAYV